ncbi:MAG: ABC transporter substrate-binding protein [Bacteroidetes bacterium]|nr:ABC transporter substrate-binding protein [Bacteroidota bacterium]MBP8074025.1 ABC transporter substrate-binding protein [Bacteroidia bacterium]
MKHSRKMANIRFLVGRSMVLACLVGLFLSSCSNPKKELVTNAPLISQNFKDDYGRNIVLSRVPTRVVSLASNITETIFAIGAEKRLAGISHDSDFPNAAASLPFVMTYPDFDLPGVVALNPDLVLASTEIHDSRITDFFDRYKINLHFQDYPDLAAVFESIREIGQMLGAEENANKLADSLAMLTQMIADSTAGQIKYKTAIVLGIDPITVVGSKSFMNDMIQKAGGSNPFGILPGKYPTVSAEQFILAAPEYVLIPTHNDRAWNDLIALHPEIHTRIPATELNHVFQMEPEAIVRPGPRIVEGLAYITRVLHSRVNLPL